MASLIGMYNPKIIKKAKNLYGQQVSKTQKLFGANKGVFRYEKKNQLRVADANVEVFIANNIIDVQNENLFKTMLRQKIVEGKNYVQGYSLGQIADFLPWVFSAQFLFQPFRTMLFCESTGRSLDNINQTYHTQSQQLINSVCQQQFLKCLTGQTDFVTKCIQYFLKTQMTWYQKFNQPFAKYWSKFSDFFSDLITQSAGIIKEAFKKLWNVIRFKSNTIKFQDQITQIKKQFEAYNKNMKLSTQEKGVVLNKFMTKLMQNLKVYGKVVINFGYLKQAASVKVIDGKTFYYFPDQPNIMITCVGGLPSVFQRSNGSLTKIPQQIFDQNFLKGIVTGRVVQIGGNIYKSYKDQTSKTLRMDNQYRLFKKDYLDPISLQSQATNGNLDRILFDLNTQNPYPKDETSQSDTVKRMGQYYAGFGGKQDTQNTQT